MVISLLMTKTNQTNSNPNLIISANVQQLTKAKNFEETLARISCEFVSKAKVIYHLKNLKWDDIFESQFMSVCVKLMSLGNINLLEAKWYAYYWICKFLHISGKKFFRPTCLCCFILQRDSEKIKCVEWYFRRDKSVIRIPYWMNLKYISTSMPNLHIKLFENLVQSAR